MTDRQFPQISELRHLLRPRKPVLDPARRRLARAFTIEDLRRIAARTVPRSVFDYVDGAAESEISISRSRSAFEALEFHPAVLKDVSTLNPSVTVLGKPSTQPFVLAPTGFTRMMHHHGETAVAQVAERAGIPYVLSTMGTTSIEDVAQASPSARKWFQLYVSRDRELSASLMRRAEKAGYEALMLTVDVPVGGARMRDARNGFGFPPSLGLRTFIDGALHPAWTFNMLTTKPLAFASMSESAADVGRHMQKLFDPAMTLDDLAWIRANWNGPIIVKGVQTVADAVRLADAGVQGIVLSNHGGRQLDRAPVPLRILPNVVDAVGDRVEISVDTGIMTGADIVACLALGARYVLVGRAYLYGMMAGGKPGAEKAVNILTGEIARTMALLGVTCTSELNHNHVGLPLPADVAAEKVLS